MAHQPLDGGIDVLVRVRDDGRIVADAHGSAVLEHGMPQREERDRAVLAHVAVHDAHVAVVAGDEVLDHELPLVARGEGSTDRLGQHGEAEGQLGEPSLVLGADGHRAGVGHARALAEGVEAGLVVELVEDARTGADAAVAGVQLGLVVGEEQRVVVAAGYDQGDLAREVRRVGVEELDEARGVEDVGVAALLDKLGVACGGEGEAAVADAGHAVALPEGARHAVGPDLGSQEDGHEGSSAPLPHC